MTLCFWKDSVLQIRWLVSNQWPIYLCICTYLKIFLYLSLQHSILNILTTLVYIVLIYCPTESTWFFKSNEYLAFNGFWDYSMIKIILIADDMTNAYTSHIVEVLSGIFGIFSVCYKNVVQVPKSYCYKKRTTMWLHLRLGMKKNPETKPYNYGLQQESFAFKYGSLFSVLCLFLGISGVLSKCSTKSGYHFSTSVLRNQMEKYDIDTSCPCVAVATVLPRCHVHHIVSQLNHLTSSLHRTYQTFVSMKTFLLWICFFMGLIYITIIKERSSCHFSNRASLPPSPLHAQTSNTGTTRTPPRVALIW